MPTSRINEILKNNWSGAHYSSLIWGHVQDMGDQLKNEMLVAFMTGRSADKTAKAVAERFGVGASDARRLVRTESCYVANQAEMDSYKECGVEKYEFVAALDARTSQICRDMDGKVFPLEEQSPGTNAPPMHPYCRSTTIAVFDDEVTEGLQRRARDPVTGKNELIPADMTYREWEKKFVDGSRKSGIIETRANEENLAKAIDSMILVDDVSEHKYTPNDILEEMQKSPVGIEMIRHIRDSDAVIRIVDEKQPHTDRGTQKENVINIYSANIKNQRVAGQTVIHEMTHYWYNVGYCQHAEAVCFAMEKMHLLGRDYLTEEEWQQMVKLAVDNYPELNWEDGGYGDFSQFNFVN